MTAIGSKADDPIQLEAEMSRPAAKVPMIANLFERKDGSIGRARPLTPEMPTERPWRFRVVNGWLTWGFRNHRAQRMTVDQQPLTGRSTRPPPRRRTPIALR
jgi:hypothetical protein